MNRSSKNHKIAFLIAGLSATISTSAFACSGCGCTLSSDWDTQGFAVKPGISFDLRYDYLNQSQLRSGHDTVSRRSLLGSGKEIEEETRNNYITANLDYRPNQDWGFNLQVPYLNRYHETYGEEATALDHASISTSHTSSIGDVKLVGRYQGFTESRNLGLQLGVKLPTGDYKENFRSGPEDGNPLDRGLQPGTGTTDLLVGVYHFGSISRDWDYFAQGMVQAALDSRDHYRPGNALNVNFGVRYVANDLFTPQLQINAKTSKHDSGSDSDRPNSGGTLAYLSPGVTANIRQDLKAYGFMQVPIYQDVNGLQLTPRWTATLGMRYEF